MQKDTIVGKINKEKAVSITHIVYAVLLIALAITVAILFIVNVVDIYNSQEISPFTVSAIESHFRAIAVPVIAFPVLVVIGFVLHFIFPIEDKKIKVENDKALSTLSKKINLDNVDLGAKKSIVRERYFRIGADFGSVLIWIIALVIILVFALNSKNYSSLNVNGSVKDLALVVFPCSLIAMGVSYAVSISNKFSKKRELALLKELVKQNREVLGESGTSGLLPIFDSISSIVEKVKGFFNKYEDVSIWVARGVLFVVAVVFIVLGVLNGGMADVLAKAVRICTECIGLG